MLEFIIQDDGCGMDQSTLARLGKRVESNTPNGYGINNVLSRMKLFFGDRFVFDVQSQSGCGTKITIQFPRVENKSDLEA